ncbi:MAG: tRNA dihydrouridine synthase DusB [Lachnospiraceae bacterium]|nr:tRNA dihydrouridine synthase DusB [Lachnospiraceae bacterium]
MRLGNLTLTDRPVFLGPMAGVTDLPYRVLCREFGADVTCTEMVSAKAMYYKNRTTEALLARAPEETLAAAQLFGSEPELMADMAQTLEERFDIIDVNMGCPVAKVVGNREGSYLMTDLPLAERIISTMAKRLKVPLTVKFRKGFDAAHVNAAEFAKMAEGAGAAAVTVHGRTREQFYSGKADWDCIAAVKAAVSIPVIGNGDVFSAEDALRMIEYTGADGVMAARGARGNPWIFREIRAALNGEPVPARPEGEEMRRVILTHARGLVRDKGEWVAVREMRKHLAWYSAGRPGASGFRERVNSLETMEALEEAVEEFFT